MDTAAKVPHEIPILISEGVWPRDHALTQRQNLEPLISDAAVRAFAPEESMIFLLASAIRHGSHSDDLHLEAGLERHDAGCRRRGPVGDIAYYASWGHLAIFYRDFGYSRGLLSLGKLDSGVERFTGSGPLQVTMESLPKAE